MVYFLLLFILLTIVLLLKIILLHKTLNEISSQMEEILHGDTNAILLVSSHDRRLLKFAAEINTHFVTLRNTQCMLENETSKLTNTITAVSHDLRTPLTAMCGYIDLLEGEEKSRAACHYTFMIKNRAEALKKLTEELFQYSILYSAEKELHYEDVSLNAALEESIAQFYAIFSKAGIFPSIDIPEFRVIRKLDRDYLARIFSNIISNAIRYSDGDFDVVLSPDGEITFSNSATGLDAVKAARLFDRFYTVVNGSGSTGLGLAVAKELTEEMGGTIHSNYDKGRLEIKISFYTHEQ